METSLRSLRRLTTICTLELRHHQVISKSLSFFISFSAELLAVGGDYPRGNVKTEIYRTQVGRWITLEDYPFDSTSVSHYAALYHDGAFYLFGGDFWKTEFSPTIARLDTKTEKWSEGGCHENFPENKSHEELILDFLLEL